MEGYQEEMSEPEEGEESDVESYLGEGLGEDMPTDETFGDEDWNDLGGSEPKPLGGIYALFDTVLNKPDSTKVSNLDKDELGSLGISVRDNMRIALMGNTFGHPIFANFFSKQAKIINDSSMSKSGWFTELFVTSKKYASKSSSSHIGNLPPQNKGKWKMFTSKGNHQQESQQ